MKKPMAMALLAAGTLLPVCTAVAQSENGVPTQAIVTIMGKDKEVPPSVRQEDIRVQVNGKQSDITDWTPLKGDRAGLELVILIDGSARTSLGRTLDDIKHFVQSLPPTTKVGIAYMEYGRAAFTAPLTADHAQALKGLRLPSGNPGSNASPYFCLSDLAKHWPSKDQDVRREVVMITDGVDRYNLRFDPSNPYVQSAIKDSLRAGLVVHSIYWLDQGFVDRSMYQTNAGQSLLSIVTQATGGYSYWQGTGNPVSLQPFLEDLGRRLENQYELGFIAHSKGKPEIANLKIKVNVPGAKVDSPGQVSVAPGGAALN